MRWSERWHRALFDAGVEVMCIDYRELGGAVDWWVSNSGLRHVHQTFIKLWLPRALGVPFWWVDPDVIVLGGFNEAIDPQQKFCCALAPHPAPRASYFSGLNTPNAAAIVAQYVGGDLNVLSSPCSLNGGLAWFDSEAFERRKLREITEALLVALGGVLSHADESVLNLLGSNHGIGSLPAGLQDFVSPEDGLVPASPDAITAKTVHFTGRVKPWMRHYPVEWPVEMYRRHLCDVWPWFAATSD
jgi:hypothetical protein